MQQVILEKEEISKNERKIKSTSKYIVELFEATKDFNLTEKEQFIFCAKKLYNERSQ